MNLSNSWKQYFLSLAFLDEVNKNITKFSLAIDSIKSETEKIKSASEDVDTVLLYADHKYKIKMLHSPTLFEGTRNRRHSKLVCLVGMGPSDIGVEVESKTPVKGCNLVTPSIEAIK
eukprot:9609335-Ditylum_brightwellii.AAC.1